MALKVLITGAAGYIGGSIVSKIVSGDSEIVKAEHVVAIVRSGDQAKELSKLGVHVLQVDLNDEVAVTDAVVRLKIDVIIHTADSLDAGIPVRLIKALGQRREASGKPSHFVHTAGLTAYTDKSGWLFGKVTDPTSVYPQVKQSADSFFVRNVSTLVTEQAEANSVQSYIVEAPLIYGTGTGAWNKLSMQIPGVIRASISDKRVHKFVEDTIVPATHISDLVTFYLRLVEGFNRGEDLPSGEKGFYFPVADAAHWWDILGQIAVALHSRGLVEDAKVLTWPSDEVAARSLGLPPQFIHIVWNGGAKVSFDMEDRVGWKPEWKVAQLLKNVNSDVQAVLELENKSSLYSAASRKV